MYRSALTKLTIYYIVLVTCIALLFSGILFAVSHNELAEGLRGQVHDLHHDDDDHDGDDDDSISQAVLTDRDDDFLVKLAYFNAAVVILSSIGSYALARRTLRPIKESYDAQVSFVAEASHELRTPLADMRLGTEVAMLELKQEKIPPRLTKALRQNLEDIEHLEVLSNRLLNVTRFKTRPADLDRELTDVSSLIEASLKQLDNTIHEHHMHVRLDTIPVQASVEAGAIQQVITVLIENAIKYSNDGSNVTIKLVERSGKAILSVSDEGIGIDKRDQKKIFESFYRSEQPEAKKRYGFGIGLSLAQQIVEAHQGSITVKSELTRGSTFTVELPLAH